MEFFQELRERAKEHIRKADHMLIMTYPLLNEPKILVSVTNNLLKSVEYAMTAILEYERLFKRIPPFPENNFDSKFFIFRDKIMKRYSLNPDHIKLITSLRELVKAHSTSSVEFSRKGQFVICSNDYELRTLTANDLKKYMSKAKVFIDDMYRLTQENDGIFR